MENNDNWIYSNRIKLNNDIIKCHIEYNFTYYLISIDKRTNKEYLEKNIYRICNKLMGQFNLNNYEIINNYLIKIY